MRIPGFCEKCHRVRNSVLVNGAGMARLAMRQVATGVCNDCTQRDDEDRLLRRHNHNPQRLTPRERQQALIEIKRGRR